MPNNARRRFIKTVLLASGATFLNGNDVLAVGGRSDIPVAPGVQGGVVGKAQIAAEPDDNGIMNCEC
jgi:hypothetical protein